MRNRIILAVFFLVVGLFTACQRKIAVLPSPIYLYTATPTFTATNSSTTTATFTSTATSTSSFTATATNTGTSTPTDSPTATPTPADSPTDTATDTSTNTPTDTATDTPTDSPTDTPTETPTDTPTQGIICAVTPVAPSFYTELEPPSLGGATGTNDSCATAENIGVVASGSSLVISGSLNSAGANDFTGDYDYYQFTAGSAGSYEFDLDCYSSGADSNLLDIIIFDSTCTYVYDPGATQPVNSVTSPPFNPGDVYYLMITAYSGTAPIPYHFTIIPP